MKAWQRWWWTAAVIALLPIHGPSLCIGSGVPGTPTPLRSTHDEDAVVGLTRPGRNGNLDGTTNRGGVLQSRATTSAPAVTSLDIDGAWHVLQVQAGSVPTAAQGASPSPSPIDDDNDFPRADEVKATTHDTAETPATAPQEASSDGRVIADDAHARAATALQRRRCLDYPGIVTALNGTPTYEVFNLNASTAYSAAGECHSTQRCSDTTRLIRCYAHSTRVTRTA